MTFMMQDQKLMTTDARGRVRVPKERREALLDEFEQSGLSGVKFAQLAGVKYPTFALWVQKRRKHGSAQRAPALSFAEGVADRGSAVVFGRKIGVRRRVRRRRLTVAPGSGRETGRECR